MGLKPGDRVEVNYPVDDFPGHVGIVKRIYDKDSEDKVIRKGDADVFWPFLNKCVAFSKDSLDLVL